VSQDRIRVLFAIPEHDRGGPDRVMFELLTKLDRRRFVPSLLVQRRTGWYLSRLSSDIEVDVIEDDRSLLGRYPVWPALRRIHRAKPDAILATQRMIITLGMASPALPRATKLVVRQANDLSADFAALVATSRLKHRLARELVLRTLRRADAVVCQSEAMRVDLASQLGDRAALHVIGNPVDVAAVASSAREADFQLRGGPALVSVGRLAPQKGFDLLLPAFARLLVRHPDAHLTVLGDGPDRASLEALAGELGIAASVTFAGFSSSPLPSVRAADLFVLASRYEGFPNAALEALACGTPIVLTDCPGANAEIVVGGMNGRLAASAEPDVLARTLEAAIAELPSYDRARIQADCERRFSSARILEAYERMIASVVAQRS
jgi:glycosyltransferase involved in cell wall biosynthesis